MLNGVQKMIVALDWTFNLTTVTIYCSWGHMSHMGTVYNMYHMGTREGVYRIQFSEDKILWRTYIRHRRTKY